MGGPWFALFCDLFFVMGQSKPCPYGFCNGAFTPKFAFHLFKSTPSVSVNTTPMTGGPGLWPS